MDGTTEVRHVLEVEWAGAGISLGRRIDQGSKLEWSKDGAYIKFPKGTRLKVPIRNHCPYAN